MHGHMNVKFVFFHLTHFNYIKTQQSQIRKIWTFSWEHVLKVEFWIPSI